MRFEQCSHEMDGGRVGLDGMGAHRAIRRGGKRNGLSNPTALRLEESKFTQVCQRWQSLSSERDHSNHTDDGDDATHDGSRCRFFLFHENGEGDDDERRGRDDRKDFARGMIEE